MDIFFALIIGALIGLGVYTVIRNYKSKQLASSQSTLLLDKIRKVCKIITVEGDFAEIYHYEDVKERFLKLITSKKKALVVIKAKAHVGFDLKKIKIEANHKKRRIILNEFPMPEILSIETDINYYDKKDGFFNKFETKDLTGLQKEAKQHIRDKVPESGLYEVAKQEALETLILVENIVETIGWRLDYSALKIEANSKKTLKT